MGVLGSGFTARFMHKGRFICFCSISQQSADGRVGAGGGWGGGWQGEGGGEGKGEREGEREVGRETLRAWATHSRAVASVPPDCCCPPALFASSVIHLLEPCFNPPSVLIECMNAKTPAHARNHHRIRNPNLQRDQQKDRQRDIFLGKIL